MTIEKLTPCSLSYGTCGVWLVSCDGNRLYNPPEEETVFSTPAPRTTSDLCGGGGGRESLLWSLVCCEWPSMKVYSKPRCANVVILLSNVLHLSLPLPAFCCIERVNIWFVWLDLTFGACTESSCSYLLHVKRPLKQQDCCAAGGGGGLGQGCKQHGISTFLTFSHTVMLQSADWRAGFYLHGNLATKQPPLYLQHTRHQLDKTGKAFHGLLLS